jgi:SAM-dependent methyltransferase
VACHLSPHCAAVTGLDLTPAMLDRARSLQTSRGLDNLSWHLGSATDLPFADGAFSVVFTRYSFHHLLDPAAAFAQMLRVCRPGGRIAVLDVYASSPAQGAAYDTIERLRDPSHVRALPIEELRGLFRTAGLQDVQEHFHRLEAELDLVLAGSFPLPGAADEVRRLVRADIGVDQLGIGAEARGTEVVFTFPLVLLCGTKPREVGRL